MEITSAIAAVGANAYQGRTPDSVDVAVIKKAMDVQESAAANLIESLKESAPSFGYKLDIRV